MLEWGLKLKTWLTRKQFVLYFKMMISKLLIICLNIVQRPTCNLYVQDKYTEIGPDSPLQAINKINDQIQPWHQVAHKVLQLGCYLYIYRMSLKLKAISQGLTSGLLFSKLSRALKTTKRRSQVSCHLPKILSRHKKLSCPYHIGVLLTVA